MDAKEYLKQIQLYNVRIRQMNEEYMRLEAIVNGTTGGFSSDKVQTSPDKNRREKAIIRLDNLGKRIQDMIAEQEEKRAEIIEMIHQLTNPRYIEILYFRYAEDIPLTSIPDVMKKNDGSEYSYDHILRLHGLALNAFREIYNDAM
uniref:Uncharacterized protein n=1 Tax=uncultured bacterium Contig643 TaxID=1393602 RepID=W0FH66_9BACT|nr:conserved hypothetical protein [uncultured bacterium Contig643]